jgi:hypothetical protein
MTVTPDTHLVLIVINPRNGMSFRPVRYRSVRYGWYWLTLLYDSLPEADTFHQMWNPAEPLALFEWQGANSITSDLVVKFSVAVVRWCLLVLVRTRLRRMLSTY